MTIIEVLLFIAENRIYFLLGIKIISLQLLRPMQTEFGGQS